MNKGCASKRKRRPALVEDSPLRRADPRTKLALALCASLAVMLPLERLAAFMLLTAAFLAWARLLPEAGRQVWRIRWVLAILFVGDWLLVDLYLATIVTLRLILLAGVMVLVVSTTTPGELRLALERLRVSYRYAFSLSLAFWGVYLLQEEWQAILEAQRARGIWLPTCARLKDWVARIRDLVALAVPAIVFTTRRAWAMTEAAHARGFGSPHRRPYRELAMGAIDWGLLAGTTVVCAGLILWR